MAVALLGGCSTYDSLTQRIAQSITPYRITVVQGNFVSKEAAAKMRVGMTRAEVKNVLGTPLLADMFHADRWDYLFYFKRGWTDVVQRRDFVVHFEGDRVVSWDGADNLPSELELLADIDGDKRGKKAKQTAVAAKAEAASSSSGEAANAQAAQAANRAVSQVPVTAPSTSSARSGAPSTGAPAGAVPQLQWRRPPQPESKDKSEPVGPTSSQSGDGSALQDQPATSK